MFMHQPNDVVLPKLRGSTLISRDSYEFPYLSQVRAMGLLNLDLSVRIEATKLTCTVRAASLEPFRAVTLVGAWSVGAVGVGVTRLLSLAFIDI